MDKKFGVIMFEGKMYKLDEMSAEELKELMTKMEENHKALEKEVEILSGMYTNEEEDEG